jgi:hypothetical protein
LSLPVAGGVVLVLLAALAALVFDAAFVAVGPKMEVEEGICILALCGSPPRCKQLTCHDRDAVPRL